MDMEQQQQLQIIHPSVLEAIARLTDPRHRDETRHKLAVNGYRRESHTLVEVNRRSLQHLVTFLDDVDSHEVVITELELGFVKLSYPPDGGLEVLIDFFSRSDTTITKATLDCCNFRTAHEASQLLAAFETNRTVTDLTLISITYLREAALGAGLARLVQNMPQLQRLDCSRNHFCVEGVRAFRPALQANPTLRELNLPGCVIIDEGIHLLADALVGNSTMEVLDIGSNYFTSNGLDDITRLLESTTHLSKICLRMNHGAFNDEASTQRFASVLARHKFLKELDFSNCKLGDGGIRIIAHCLVGNTTMKMLNISGNHITAVGLDDITALFESTRLQSIDFQYNEGIFDDEMATQRFVSTLHQKNTSAQELPGIGAQGPPRNRALVFPVSIRKASSTSIKNSLIRNRQLNSLNLLLAAPPSSSPPCQQHWNAATLMLKISHKAITKFATIPNHAGASAIFKLCTARPQLLEKRLQRPAAAATTTIAAATTTTTTSAIAAAAVSQGEKRRRLL